MTRQRALHLLLGGLLLLAACGSDAVNETAADSTTTSTGISDVEQVSDAPESVALGDATAEDEPTTTETTTPEAVVCTAPEVQGHFVDVAIDDPDGGLNVRSGAGAANDIIATYPRGSELITTGQCTTVDTATWWEITATDGSESGWVASRFLSELPVFNPGLGAEIIDPDLAGLAATDTDAVIELLADRYGFDADRTITTIDVVGQDAQGGTATYEVTGFQDDASDGFIFEIDFIFTFADSDSSEVSGVEPTRVTTRALCTRGVTDDGLCV